MTAFLREQVLAGSDDGVHDRLHQKGDGAAHPTERPPTTLAALRIFAMAHRPWLRIAPCLCGR
jgi:hypothetical protein